LLTRADKRLTKIAKSYIWWKTPKETLSDPIFFIAHVMNLATWEDAMYVLKKYRRNNFLQTIKMVSPGILNPKSWYFWHRWLGVVPSPYPKRKMI